MGMDAYDAKSPRIHFIEARAHPVDCKRGTADIHIHAWPSAAEFGERACVCRSKDRKRGRGRDQDKHCKIGRSHIEMLS